MYELRYGDGVNAFKARQMTTKEIKAIMEAINGCLGVIGTMAGNERGIMTGIADKELFDTYYRLHKCWLYLHSILEYREALESLKKSVIEEVQE